MAFLNRMIEHIHLIEDTLKNVKYPRRSGGKEDLDRGSNPEDGIVVKTNGRCVSPEQWPESPNELGSCCSRDM